jgi:hypothetical protein
VNPAGKLAAFGVVLVAVLGGGAALGSVVGPIDVEDEPAGHVEHGAAGGDADHQASHSPEAEGAVGAGDESLPGGVLVSQAGYTLEPEATVVDGAAGTPLRFRIVGPDGAAVRDYDLGHERELHLIVVDRDLQTYAHLHPTRDDHGTWSADLPALAPGAYRAVADFVVTDGPGLTLGVDLTVPGPDEPTSLPEAATTATVDGYEVDLAGTPAAGTASELTLTVRHRGEPVTDLEPYLGAAGHLVAFRSGDLAYLHVHPLDADDAEPADAGALGPEVRFAVEVPSPGDYRLFFDFSHEGEVRTASFTVHVPAADDGAGAHADQGGH